MLSRPSSRRRSEHQEINVNLVPMLDALVTLVAFLLLSMAFVSIAMIDTPAPLLAPAEAQVEKIKEKPLQLTAFIQEKQIIISDWSGSRLNHKILSITDSKTGELRYDYEKLHQLLLNIKSKYPKESKLILKPDSGVSYEALVGIMDAARFFEKTDPPLYKKNAQGVDEPEKFLFSEVIFGNIMS